MKKKAIWLCCVLCLLLGSVYAQQQVTGRITDDRGNGVENVSVSLKGTTTTTLTNTNGEFAIRAVNGQRLVFSSIGFVTKEVDVTSTRIDVSLDRSTGDLGEVVVVGYGTQRRGAITGAVSTVKGEQLTKRPSSNTTMALQGFAPGLVIQQGSGQPGADGGSINIRGIGSITGANGPLIVVDG
ncbi:MAG TPA: carboxypeptidase-like regulatory domain-containing protein, partial [Flavisolibacter sp.]